MNQLGFDFERGMPRAPRKRNFRAWFRRIAAPWIGLAVVMTLLWLLLAKLTHLAFDV